MAGLDAVLVEGKSGFDGFHRNDTPLHRCRKTSLDAALGSWREGRRLPFDSNVMCALKRDRRYCE